MKYTRTIQRAIDYMEEVKEVSKIKKYRGTPHEFTNKSEKVIMDGPYIKFPQYPKIINRQTLNRLVMLGYAEYTDKSKEVAVFIDKDSIDKELKIKSEKYDELHNLVDYMFYTIGTQWETGMDIEELVGELRLFMYGESEE